MLHQGCFRIETVGAAAHRAEVVENRLCACGGDFEECSPIEFSTDRGYPIEITVRTQRQTGVGICSIRMPGEVVQDRQHSGRSDFEHCSAAAAAICRVTTLARRAVVIAVIALYQNPHRQCSIVAVKPFEVPEHGLFAVGGELVNYSTAVLVAGAGWAPA